MSDAGAILARALCEKIRPILAGHPAEVQGAVLADLLSIWLAGHRIEGDPQATARLHNTLIHFHTKGVRELLSASIAQLDGETRS